MGVKASRLARALGDHRGHSWASRLARALSDPLKRRLTLAEGRTTEAKRRFRRGIAKRGEGHMKGKKAFEEALEAGSAG
jgi:hypothetical protein